MKRSNVIFALFVVVVVLVFGTLALMDSLDGNKPPNAPSFEPIGWTGTDGRTELKCTGQSDVFLIRRGFEAYREGEPADGETRARPTYRKAYFRYDGGHGMLHPSTLEEWSAAAGPVSTCDRSYLGPIGDFSDPAHRYELFYKGRQVPITGDYCEALCISPSGEWLAVLSADADGAIKIPFMGGPGSSGQHYHEIFSLSSLARMHGPDPLSLVTLKGPGLANTITICWSADERFVLYFDSTSLSVIPVELGRDEHDPRR